MVNSHPQSLLMKNILQKLKTAYHSNLVCVNVIYIFSLSLQVPSLELHWRTNISGIMLITDAVQEVNFADPKSGNAEVGPEDSIPSPSPEKPAIVEVIGNQESSSCSEYVPTSSPEGSSSSTWTHNSSSDPTISDSNVRKATRPRSYLLCNRVRVYPCYPDIALPNGITVMPISDNQWVAVSLEFPMEQGYWFSAVDGSLSP